MKNQRKKRQLPEGQARAREAKAETPEQDPTVDHLLTLLF